MASGVTGVPLGAFIGQHFGWRETFLAPMMQELAGYSGPAVSWILLAYGIAVAIGNIWGGKLAARHGAVPALRGRLDKKYQPQSA